MRVSIQAVFENGFLRPLMPLILPNQTQIQLILGTEIYTWVKLDVINQ